MSYRRALILIAIPLCLLRSAPSLGGQAPVAFIVTGAGPSSGPHVRVLNAATGEEIIAFYAYDPQFSGGVRVATADVNGDGVPDIITAAGPGGGPHVEVFDGASICWVRSFCSKASGRTIRISAEECMSRPGMCHNLGLPAHPGRLEQPG